MLKKDNKIKNRKKAIKMIEEDKNEMKSYKITKRC